MLAAAAATSGAHTTTTAAADDLFTTPAALAAAKHVLQGGRQSPTTPLARVAMASRPPLVTHAVAAVDALAAAVAAAAGRDEHALLSAAASLLGAPTRDLAVATAATPTTIRAAAGVVLVLAPPGLVATDGAPVADGAGVGDDGGGEDGDAPQTRPRTRSPRSGTGRAHDWTTSPESQALVYLFSKCPELASEALGRIYCGTIGVFVVLLESKTGRLS